MKECKLVLVQRVQFLEEKRFSAHACSENTREECVKEKRLCFSENGVLFFFS